MVAIVLVGRQEFSCQRADQALFLNLNAVPTSTIVSLGSIGAPFRHQHLISIPHYSGEVNQNRS